MVEGLPSVPEPPASEAEPLFSLHAILTALWSREPTPAEVEWFLGSGVDLAQIIRTAISTPSFETLYKLIKTSAFQQKGHWSRDYQAVGLGVSRPDMRFESWLRDMYLPRLGARAGSIAIMFDHLLAHARTGGVIVETGCLRVAGNWAGDGQSTFMLDHFADETMATFFSIDINPYSVSTARSVCSPATNVLLNDAIRAIHSLSRLLGGRKIDLLYLDSFDVDFQNPVPSAKHHLKELTAAMPLLGPGSLICIDDCKIGDQSTGKGLFVNEYLTEIGALQLYDGYQALWMVR